MAGTPHTGIDQLKYSDIVARVESFNAKCGNWVPLRIAFLGNITVDPLLPCLQYLCYEESIKLAILIFIQSFVNEV